MNPVGMMNPKNYSKKLGLVMVFGGMVWQREDIPIMWRVGGVVVLGVTYLVMQGIVDNSKAKNGINPSTSSNESQIVESK